VDVGWGPNVNECRGVEGVEPVGFVQAVVVSVVKVGVPLVDTGVVVGG
jgi:hypothetical protein